MFKGLCLHGNPFDVIMVSVNGKLEFISVSCGMFKSLGLQCNPLEVIMVSGQCKL